MKRIIPIALCAVLTLLTSCDNDEARFSSSQIHNALFEMKGTYHGTMDDIYSFVLHPDDVTCTDATGTVRIVFSQIFGGDANYSYHNVMINLSPTELWVDGEKYEPFSQLVYHFEGTCE